MVIFYKKHGEMVEWFKAAVLKTAGGQLPEGSNPSFSAIFILKKNENGERSRKASLNAATAALHSKGAAFSSHLHKNKEALLVKTLPAPFHYAAASRFSRL